MMRIRGAGERYSERDSDLFSYRTNSINMKIMDMSKVDVRLGPGLQHPSESI